MKIVADQQIAYIKDYFGAYDLVLKPGRAISQADVKDADILIVRSVTKVNAALLNHSNVKFVGTVTSGCDHLDIDYLNQQSIAYATAHGFNAPPVADYVLCVVAALQLKNLLRIEKPKVAIVGLGQVGERVLNYFNILGFDVIQSDPIRQVNEKEFVSTPIDEIENCDLITLHVPLTKQGEHPTYHFIDKNFLRKQKPGCVLLNASRGSVVHSADLKQAGRHLEWCFDVWEHEPDIDHTVMQNCEIATPHIAGYSVQSKIRGIDMLYKGACALQLLPQSRQELIEMPTQKLKFAGEKHHWQEIVLGVFNPNLLTVMMKTRLDDVAKNIGDEFDDMRHQFTYRHEMSCTQVVAEGITKETAECLQSLGLKLV